MKVHLDEKVIEEGNMEGGSNNRSKKLVELERVQNELGCSDLH